MWVPADQAYKLVCVECGEVLLDDVDGLELEWDGTCEGPGDTLGVHVREVIKSKDKFGG